MQFTEIHLHKKARMKICFTMMMEKITNEGQLNHLKIIETTIFAIAMQFSKSLLLGTLTIIATA